MDFNLAEDETIGEFETALKPITSVELSRSCQLRCAASDIDRSETSRRRTIARYRHTSSRAPRPQRLRVSGLVVEHARRFGLHDARRDLAVVARARDDLDGATTARRLGLVPVPDAESRIVAAVVLARAPLERRPLAPSRPPRARDDARPPSRRYRARGRRGARRRGRGARRVSRVVASVSRSTARA